MRKTLSNKPWIFVAAGFLTFVAVWVSFIVFAVKNQPPQVERIARGTVVSQAQPKQP